MALPKKMRPVDVKYAAAMNRRIARVEVECNAQVMRAFNRVLTVIEREKNEWLIRMDRLNRGVK